MEPLRQQRGASFLSRAEGTAPQARAPVPSSQDLRFAIERHAALRAAREYRRPAAAQIGARAASGARVEGRILCRLGQSLLCRAVPRRFLFLKRRMPRGSAATAQGRLVMRPATSRRRWRIGIPRLRRRGRGRTQSGQEKGGREKREGGALPLAVVLSTSEWPQAQRVRWLHARLGFSGTILQGDTSGGSSSGARGSSFDTMA